MGLACELVQVHTYAPTPDAAKAGATGQSYAPRTTAILEPDEIGMVFGRDDREFRQLIMLAGKGPMILQRAFADKHEVFG